MLPFARGAFALRFFFVATLDGCSKLRYCATCGGGKANLRIGGTSGAALKDATGTNDRIMHE